MIVHAQVSRTRNLFSPSADLVECRADQTAQACLVNLSIDDTAALQA
jgi:hypothetical protein